MMVYSGIAVVGLPVGVDDQYPEPTAWTSTRVGLTRVVARVTGLNLANSLLLAARRT